MTVNSFSNVFYFFPLRHVARVSFYVKQQCFLFCFIVLSILVREYIYVVHIGKVLSFISG
jgi:hypothetical protein